MNRHGAREPTIVRESSVQRHGSVPEQLRFENVNPSAPAHQRSDTHPLQPHPYIDHRDVVQIDGQYYSKSMLDNARLNL